MRTTSIKLPEHLDRQLTALARQRHSTRSTLIREALEAFTKQSKPTFASLAADLIGSVAGPEDLSTNPKHMSGFGE